MAVTNTYFNQFSRNLHSLNKYWYTMPYTHYTAGVIRKWASFSWECFHAKEVLSRFYMSDWFPFMIKSQSWKISITLHDGGISSTYNLKHLSEELSSTTNVFSIPFHFILNDENERNGGKFCDKNMICLYVYIHWNT